MTTPFPVAVAAGDHDQPSPAVKTRPALIDLKEVCRRTSLGRSTIQKLITAGTFPPRVKIPGIGNVTRWSAEAVDAWIEDRIAGR